MIKRVEYSYPLIRNLSESLRSAFNPYSELNSKPKGEMTKFSITLTGGQRASTENQFVLPILINGGITPFWFGFLAEFAGAKFHYLQHASLSVFQNVGSPAPLFRADWDPIDAAGTSTHAQPHWHFDQSFQQIENYVRARLPADQITDFDPEGVNRIFDGMVDCGRIHFAMTSLWENINVPAYKKKLYDSDDFPKWFKNLTVYVAEQIVYVVSHLPPHIAIKEFSVV